MTKEYKAITDNINQHLVKLRQAMPDAMNGFTQLAQNATKDGVLDKKTKELIALAIGVSTRCDGCIGFHAKALVKLGATKEELMEMLAMTVYMGGGPSLMYAADAIQAFEEFSADS